MVDVLKFPYLTTRQGVFYVKRTVPKELHAPGRPRQVWRSLKTRDEKLAKRVYRIEEAAIEATFDGWRRELIGSTTDPVSDDALPATLSAAAAKQIIAEFGHTLFEADFRRRGELWKLAEADGEAFWRGDVIPLPEDNARNRFFFVLQEDGARDLCFLFALHRVREDRAAHLKTLHRLGDVSEHEPRAARELAARHLTVRTSDQARLARLLLEAEIATIERILSDEKLPEPAGMIESASAVPPTTAPVPAAAKMSALIEPYIAAQQREREWTDKDAMRWRGHLEEFVATVGDKPANAYTKPDGVDFKDVQLALPSRRTANPFRGLPIRKAAKLATDLRAKGQDVDLLSPLTIKDKIGCVSNFFVWANSRDASVMNPVGGLAIRRKKSRHGSKRGPWKIDELNTMFAAPIYTGCKSLRRWQDKGELVLRDTAIFWVPLVGLFTGMRLGEIIQLRTSDVKAGSDITHFDVTTDSEDDVDEADTKSLKTHTSRRSIPIHHTLKALGFDNFVAARRASGKDRLFPEYGKAQDDGSWSKAFSKHFKRFRDSLGLTRDGTDFHSFRHNVEDALRNAPGISKELRDAIQGHGENGVSARYGSGHYLTTLDAAVQKISYEGLTLDHLIIETKG